MDPRHHQTVQPNRNRLPRPRTFSWSIFGRVSACSSLANSSCGVDIDLTQQLSIPNEQVEEIVVSLILDEKIKGRIDQVTGRLELERQCVEPLFPLLVMLGVRGFSRASAEENASDPREPRIVDNVTSTALEVRRYQTLEAWTGQLVAIQSNLMAKAATAGSDRLQGGAGPGGPGGPAGAIPNLMLGDWQSSTSSSRMGEAY